MFGMTPWKKESRSLARPDEFPISRIRDEFEAIFDRVFGGLPGPFATDWGMRSFWGLDVEENDKEVTIRAAAPGFDKEDFDLQVSGNLLTIRAKHKQEAQDKKDNSHFSERRYGRFQQSFPVPPGIDTDHVEARYRNGVLEICLKKKPEAQGTRIQVADDFKQNSEQQKVEARKETKKRDESRNK